MLRERIQASNYSFFDKLKSIDYLLILLIIAIGAISVFAIYSTCLLYTSDAADE